MISLSNLYSLTISQALFEFRNSDVWLLIFGIINCQSGTRHTERALPPTPQRGGPDSVWLQWLRFARFNNTNFIIGLRRIDNFLT